MDEGFRFSDIVVVGSGSLTLSVATHLASVDRSVTLIEIPETTRFPMRARAERMGIDVETVSKRDVPFFLDQRAREAKSALCADTPNMRKPLLVLSVENMYVFPRPIAEHPLIEILNYHNSLLPRHRGMHAEAWAIFENDERAGFTWHLVDASLDTGSIVYQEAFNVTQKETSLELLGKCSKQALKAFKQFFAHYERGTIRPICQSVLSEVPCKTHNRHERPNDGILDVTWNLKKIASFLRSYDYGKLRHLGTPSLILEGERYTWNSYLLELADSPNAEVHEQAETVAEAQPCSWQLDFDLGRLVFTDERMGRITLNGLQAAQVA